jgi:hypothetical protein
MIVGECLAGFLRRWSQMVAALVIASDCLEKMNFVVLFGTTWVPVYEYCVGWFRLKFFGSFGGGGEE